MMFHPDFNYDKLFAFIQVVLCNFMLKIKC